METNGLAPSIAKALAKTRACSSAIPTSINLPLLTYSSLISCVNPKDAGVPAFKTTALLLVSNNSFKLL